jgi:3-hydroxybutyryl-CoA dehydrogenase
VTTEPIGAVGIVGAGTMGAGIAQLAALADYETLLLDADAGALAAGVERLGADLRRGAERERWSVEDAEAAAARVEPVSELGALAGCGLILEAAPEDLELKRDLFARLEAICGEDCVLATNTSSLPVGQIAAGLERPERLGGMHFFNPPALMKLVEVIAGDRTTEPVVATIEAVARRMDRTPVRCSDSPGFVVNRCNRPFTLESLRILDEGVADHVAIDTVIREDGGYRMGPFALMDLVGIDVNLEVARSFYRQRPEPRWQPHPIQERMVAEGRLGRKTGRGFYEYGDAAADPPGPELEPDQREAILERVVAALINEACFAVAEGVAEPGDVDTAMRLGLNHPRGPFEWAERLGASRAETVLDALRSQTSDPRYEVAPLLRRMAHSDQSDS